MKKSQSNWRIKAIWINYFLAITSLLLFGYSLSGLSMPSNGLRQEPNKNDQNRKSAKRRIVSLSGDIKSILKLAVPSKNGRSSYSTNKSRSVIRDYLRSVDFESWDVSCLLAFQDQLHELIKEEKGEEIYQLAMEFILERRPNLVVENIRALASERTMEEQAIIGRALWNSKEAVMGAKDRGASDGEGLFVTLMLIGASESASTAEDIRIVWQLSNGTDNSALHADLIYRSIERVVDKAPDAPTAYQDLKAIEGYAMETGSERDTFLCNSVGMQRFPFEFLPSMDLNSSSTKTELDERLANSFISGALRVDPERGLNMACEVHDMGSRLYISRELVRKWLKTDPMAASKAVSLISDNEVFVAAANEIAVYLDSSGDASAADLWRTRSKRP